MRRPNQLALLLLQSQGVIKLKPNAGFKASPRDVAENPKKLKFVELDAAQLPRSLDDLDAAAINGNYAEKANLDPTKDGIAIESPKGPYANVIAIRVADKEVGKAEAAIGARLTGRKRRKVPNGTGLGLSSLVPVIVTRLTS